ncbi:hypothetical protein J4Q44_G00236810 [Coregonus suidteri]|uniref:Uncharacterized protein n=1 Tax=Coregonus suidteri TaxID=861788 RepID=A0AAN8QP06_9TELE
MKRPSQRYLLQKGEGHSMASEQIIMNFIQLLQPLQTIHEVQSLSPIQKLSRSYTTSSYNTQMRSKKPGPMMLVDGTYMPV